MMMMITYSKCVFVVVGVQPAMCVYTVFSSVACPARPNFSALSHKRHDYRRKDSEHMCFDILYNRCLEQMSFYEELSEIWSKMLRVLHVRYPILLSDFNQTWVFYTDFLKILKIEFHENPSRENRVAPCGRTDRHGEANSRHLAILRTRLTTVTSEQVVAEMMPIHVSVLSR